MKKALILAGLLFVFALPTRAQTTEELLKKLEDATDRYEKAKAHYTDVCFFLAIAELRQYKYVSAINALTNKNINETYYVLRVRAVARASLGKPYYKLAEEDLLKAVKQLGEYPSRDLIICLETYLDLLKLDKRFEEANQLDEKICGFQKQLKDEKFK